MSNPTRAEQPALLFFLFLPRHSLCHCLCLQGQCLCLQGQIQIQIQIERKRATKPVQRPTSTTSEPSQVRGLGCIPRSLPHSAHLFLFLFLFLFQTRFFRPRSPPELGTVSTTLLCTKDTVAVSETLRLGGIRLLLQNLLQDLHLQQQQGLHHLESVWSSRRQSTRCRGLTVRRGHTRRDCTQGTSPARLTNTCTLSSPKES